MLSIATAGALIGSMMVEPIIVLTLISLNLLICIEAAHRILTLVQRLELANVPRRERCSQTEV